LNTFLSWVQSAACLLAAGVGVASAHVTVAAPGVTAGASDGVITFRVPDESDTASTIGLKLQLPASTPIAGVLVQPHPGWSSTVKQTKLATPIKTDDGEITQVISEIDWTADTATAGIKPGQFDQFALIAGKLPDGVSSLTFKAIQRYSDGKDVAWIDLPAPGSSAEPDHPAPVLSLTATTADGSASPTASANPSVSTFPAAAAATTASENSASKASATTGIVLGGLGVLLGAAALVIALRKRSA
jgi:periplasmic copper chaperone A